MGLLRRGNYVEINTFRHNVIYCDPENSILPSTGKLTLIHQTYLKRIWQTEKKRTGIRCVVCSYFHVSSYLRKSSCAASAKKLSGKGTNMLAVLCLSLKISGSLLTQSSQPYAPSLRDSDALLRYTRMYIMKPPLSLRAQKQFTQAGVAAASSNPLHPYVTPAMFFLLYSVWYSFVSVSLVKKPL